MKSTIMISMVIGSIIGSYIPVLWGSFFSLSSIFLGAVGGFLGIWIGYKLAIRMGF
jgi:hypothetical protein